jgi:hypothetical protein
MQNTMLKTGDKVKFLNDTGGGVITGFQSKNIALVEREDGFEIPVMINELILSDEPDNYNKAHTNNSENIKQTPPQAEPEPEHVPEIIEGNDKPNFYMAFFPADQHNPVGGEIEVYLINDSNFTLLYQYIHFDEQKYTTVDAGELEPNTKQILESLSMTDLSNLPKFMFRLLPHTKESKTLEGPFIKEITVSGVKFFKEKSFIENDYFDGNAMVFDLIEKPLSDEIDKLTDRDFEKIINQKDKINRPATEQNKAKTTPEIVEVDLHIDELIDSTNGLSNREILDIQMDKFQSEMEHAIKNRVKRIIFIHGVGNGVLKQEISRKLKSKYARYNHQDASFKEYGYGATMVILRRK